MEELAILNNFLKLRRFQLISLKELAEISFALPSARVFLSNLFKISSISEISDCHLPF